METRKFTVILLPQREGGFQVFFPYYPGCITEGDTIEETLKNAKEAMELVLESELEQGEEIPEFVHVPYVIVGEIEVTVPERAGVQLG